VVSQARPESFGTGPRSIGAAAMPSRIWHGRLGSVHRLSLGDSERRGQATGGENWEPLGKCLNAPAQLRARVAAFFSRTCPMKFRARLAGVLVWPPSLGTAAL
jgi:hypothetical protein